MSILADILANRSIKPTVRSVVEAGILPDGIPPFLTTSSLAQHLLVDDPRYLVTADVVGQSASFNASKRGFQRRNFAVPHPIFIRDAASFITRNWESLEHHFGRSHGSVSNPSPALAGHRSFGITPHAALPLLRLQKLARFKFCLVTDVSRCYPSIYTHSIPWALNGKLAAKKDTNPQSANIFGNRLDYIMRMAQDRQTMGIAVGPDTSRVTAEIVLCAVDELFQAKANKQLSYVRHVDDYWIGGNTVSECEQSLHDLRVSLNEYSLDINELKTRIVPLTAVTAEHWPYDLERELQDELSGAATDRSRMRVVSLLGRIIDLSKKEEDDGIIKYFLRRIDHWSVWEEYWDVLEPFLIHCARQFIHSMDYVSRVISWRLRLDLAVNRGLWAEIAVQSLNEAASSAKDAEALWSLWLAKELHADIPGDVTANIASTNGPLVLAVLAHAMSHGMTTGLDAAQLWGRVGKNPLLGSEWPLVLELQHLSIASPQALDLGASEVARILYDSRSSIVDWDANILAVDENGNLSKSALSGITSDYDDDDAEIATDNALYSLEEF